MTLTHIGRVHSSQKAFDLALQHYQEALEIRKQTGFRLGQAQSLQAIAGVYSAMNRRAEAKQLLNEALGLWQEVKDQRGQAFALGALAKVERDSGDLNISLGHITDAVALIETVRSNIAGRELRDAVFASSRELYDVYIDTLMLMHKARPRSGYDQRAIEIAERARSRSLLEVLMESRAEIEHGVDRDLAERERYLLEQISVKSEQRVRRLAAGSSQRNDKADAELERLSSQLATVEGEIRRRNPHYAELVAPKPISAAEISELLDDDTVLIEYALGEDRSYAWAITSTDMVSAQLPGKGHIESVIRRFHNAITAPARTVQGETDEQKRARVSKAERDYPYAAAALSRLLVNPFVLQLQRTKRLAIVADGAVQYVAFVALPIRTPDGNSKPLIADHEIVTLSSANVLKEQRRSRNREPRSRGKLVALLADPVFSAFDDRFGDASSSGFRGDNLRQKLRATPGAGDSVLMRALRSAGPAKAFDRLRFSRREALAIAEMVGQDHRLLALDFEASLSTVLNPDLRNYSIVHFATHGIASTERPELSGMVLSLVDRRRRNVAGFLNLPRIFNLALPAELVVLSACDTALGKEIRGEGLMSVTRAFMYGGARRVVSSLWAADDASTAKLMEYFYREMLITRRPPAAALAAAQNAMRQEPLWSAPYKWAAFGISGDWSGSVAEAIGLTGQQHARPR
jgi:CHAT domain-containing protein